MNLPPPPALSAGGLSLLPNFQKGGLTGCPFLEGGCWKIGDYFFEQGVGGWGEGLPFIIFVKSVILDVLNTF